MCIHRQNRVVIEIDLGDLVGQPKNGAVICPLPFIDMHGLESAPAALVDLDIFGIQRLQIV